MKAENKAHSWMCLFTQQVVSDTVEALATGCRGY